jgi:uncharacterized repeat protein (TIGR04138 family)
MTTPDRDLAEVARSNPQYAYEAYEFVLLQALRHTQKLLGRAPAEPEGEQLEAAQLDVSSAELLEGIRDLALREFGMMARTVFHRWGIDRTDDIGRIVFNLVEGGMIIMTEEETLDHFHNVYDLDEVLVKQYQIRLEGAESG